MVTAPLDIVWVVLSAALVFLMQPGFLCLESGLTRSKNSINVAIKNLADFGFSMTLFWAIGFGLMFGASQLGWFGTTHFCLSLEGDGASLAPFFLFQAMFCGTATTIVSGAVAERMRFAGYLAVTVLQATLIYTVFGHWAWGGLHEIGHGGGRGWLLELGFYDFAGATVVHSVGGWVALAAVLLIGPRDGRFPSDGPPRRVSGQNMPLAMLGVLLLWIGWIGFNGGSHLRLGPEVAVIIVNTMLAGAAGLVAAMTLSWSWHGRADVHLVMNGALAGLVAITASCNAVSAPAALVIGAVGAVVMAACTRLLLWLRIDDVVGAIPVHAAAGVWGTLAVALFIQEPWLTTDRVSQLGIQALGVAVCFVWSFGSAFVLLRLVDVFIRLRVAPKDEHRGLNVVEHGATTEVLDLLHDMQWQAQTDDLSHRVPVEPFTEIGQIAALYNQALESLEESSTNVRKYAAELERSNRDLSEFASIASHDLQAPLRRVRDLCHVLRRDYVDQLDAQGNEFIDFIISEADRMQALVNDLLAYSKVGSSPKATAPADASVALRQALATLEPQIRASGARITCDPLPVVLADAAQVTQLLENLLSNAIKYCHGTPEVHITARREGEWWGFSVVDNGIGIDPKYAAGIFEMLRRLHGTDEYEGTGIGLAICKRIVERHGGRIWMEPNPHGGSVFCFTLPAVD